MRKIATSLLALLAGTLSVFAQLTATNGGPDGYGYSWVSSDDTTANLNFNWVDISSVGTDITSGLGDDNSVGPFNIGFNLPYYWYDVSTFFIGSNGYITFGKGETISSGSAASYFSAFPNMDGKSNIVAPFLTDLAFNNASGGQPNIGSVYYYSNASDSLVITFNDVPFWTNNANGWDGSNTFQIVFSKADTTISINYLEQIGSWNSSYDAGADASQIGIESIEGLEGLTCGSMEKPTDSLSIVFSLHKNPNFTLTDVSSSANNNEKSGGIFISAVKDASFNSDVQNTGTNDITSSFNVNVNIARSATGSASIFTDTEAVTSLTAGTTQNVAYPNTLNPAGVQAELGRSYYMITEAVIADDVTANNERLSEVVVLDDIDPSQVSMSFADMSATPSQFGFEGGAVYMEPPYYPIDIVALEYMIVTQGTIPTTGFFARIWDNSGTNGAPGSTPLLTKYVDSLGINISGNTTSVFLDTSEIVTINSGGFYVSYQIRNQAGDIVLGADISSSAPKSNQNYEVLAGTFGEYRSNATEDLMISAIIDASIALPDTIGISEKLNVELGEVYPNPASNSASINFSVEESSAVSFTVKNLIGQNVKNVNLGSVAPGTKTITFDVNDLESGIYFYTLNVNEKTYTKKFIVK